MFGGFLTPGAEVEVGRAFQHIGELASRFLDSLADGRKRRLYNEGGFILGFQFLKLGARF